MLAETLAAGEDDRLPAAVALLEQVAEAAPGGDVNVGQPFAPRRVDREQSGARRRLEVEAVADREEAAAVEAGGLEISRGGGDRRPIVVDAEQPHVRTGRRNRLGANAGEERRLETGELFEGPQRPQPVRRQTEGDRGRLGEKRAGAAHRIDHRTATVPARGEDRRRGDLLAQRRRGAFDAIAAAIERLAGGVDQQCRLVVVQADAQRQVGPVALDRGAPAEALALGVDQAVLDLERHPAGVAHARAARRGVDREGAVGHQPGVLERPRAGVERLVVRGRPARQLEQHAVGAAQAPVAAHSGGEVAVEADAADVDAGGGEAERLHLGEQGFLEAAGAGGDPAPGDGCAGALHAGGRSSRR
ncbi:MAG: hypothetical protein AMXMBFR36_11090 [Acidobacteriota bacterium]